MKYEFKLYWEAARAGIFAAVVFALTAIVGLNGGGVEDWESWGLSVLAGAVSAAAAAALALLTRKQA